MTNASELKAVKEEADKNKHDELQKTIPENTKKTADNTSDMVKLLGGTPSTNENGSTKDARKTGTPVATRQEVHLVLHTAAGIIMDAIGHYSDQAASLVKGLKGAGAK